MRSVVLVAVLLTLCVVLKADLPEFVPCAFHAQFLTRVLNPDREVVATSRDDVYYDHDDLWRWDSSFSGVIGVIDPQDWTIIWRPDLKTCYHDLGDKCVLNDGGGSKMTPLPYDWFLRGTKGVSWFKLSGVYEGMPVDIYHATAYVTKYGITVTINVHILTQDQALVLVNGTAKNDQVDLTYTMDTVIYEQKSGTAANLFIPSARCTNGTVISAPKAASDSFVKQCYRTASASHATVCWVALLLALFLSLLI